jgi:16S rRNA (adenine1518-N6/adenine1519-N6)-dimethyltransferase
MIKKESTNQKKFFSLPYSPQKKLGQNFLFSSKYLYQIVTHCPISSDTVIIEIGSGYGNLTKFLAETNCQKVLSFEKDPQLFQWLVKNEKDKKITYFEQDALLIN